MLLVQVVGAAGMLINTMGWVDGLGFELLLHSITAMKANIVLVVGEDRLLTQLQTKYQVCRQHLSLYRQAAILSACSALHPSLSLWHGGQLQLGLHALTCFPLYYMQELSLVCILCQDQHLLRCLMHTCVFMLPE